MSFDYFVAVRAQTWPTSGGVQEALRQFGYPVRLVSASDAPFEIQNGALPVLFEDRPVTIEAEMEQAADIEDPESLFGYIAQAAAPAYPICDGDHFLTLTFRSDADEIRAGLYLAAAMVRAFDGYGFENQHETHGQSTFAEQMVREAADENLWID